MTADKSRRAFLVYALLAVRIVALGTPTALAAHAEGVSPLHSGSWPIHNGRNYQPTEDELRALHLQDVTPDQAREIDRLYDQLLAGSEKVHTPRKNGAN
jgi:uroporphyrinogen-III synthase